MIDEADILALAEYLVRTRGREAREFVASRIENSNQPGEWQRVAEAMNRLLGIDRNVPGKAPRRA